MKIVQGTKQVGMTMECQECKLYGLSETNFTKARFESLFISVLNTCVLIEVT